MTAKQSDYGPFSSSLIHPMPSSDDDQKRLETFLGTDNVRKAVTLKLNPQTGIHILPFACHYLQNLTSLYVSSTNMPSLRFLGSSFPKVKELSVVDCRLKSLDGLSSFPNVQFLRAPYNELCNVDQCVFLLHLCHLDLEKNLIENIKTLQWLVLCPKLISLVTANNPLLLEDGVAEKAPCSTGEIRKMLPNLKYLDGYKLEMCSMKPERSWKWLKSSMAKRRRYNIPDKFSRVLMVDGNVFQSENALADSAENEMDTFEEQ